VSTHWLLSSHCRVRATAAANGLEQQQQQQLVARVVAPHSNAEGGGQERQRPSSLTSQRQPSTHAPGSSSGGTMTRSTISRSYGPVRPAPCAPQYFDDWQEQTLHTWQTPVKQTRQVEGAPQPVTSY
jgi:hypothetical protein